MSAVVENVAQSIQDFEKRVAGLIGESKPNMKSEPPVAEASKEAKPTVASILLELTTIAAQLANVDQTMAEVNKGAPEEEEAKRWHEISTQALRTSRNMLAEKQLKCLAELSTLTGAAPRAQPTKQKTEPEENPEAKPSTGASTWDSWSRADVSTCPEFVPPPPGLEQVQGVGELGGSNSGSLRHDLEMLRHAQPETVIIVRKIKKLGFESPQLLKQHFAQYGRVSEILVAHSHVKPTPKRPNGRVRPAALGFVIMGSAEGVQKAFDAGATQDVCGSPIELASFDSFDNHYGQEEGAADEN